MTSRVRMPVLAAAACLVLPGNAPGQRVAEGYHYDAPSEVRLGEVGAEAKLLNWVEQIRGRTQELYFRNTSNEPIQIISYDFFECTNVIGVPCNEELEGPRLEPGETIRLESIRQRNFEQRWSYRYRFQDRLTRPHGELAGQPGLDRGLGWIVGAAEDGSPIAFVVGRAPGYTGLAVVDETRKRALVLLTNSDGGLALSEQVLAFLDPWSHPIVKGYLKSYPEASN